MINKGEKGRKKKEEKIFGERYRRVTGQKRGGRWQGARESLEIARRLGVAYCRLNRRVSIGQDQGSRDGASIYFIEIVRRLVSSEPSSPLSVIRGPRRCIDVAVVELFFGVEDVVSVVALVDVNLFCEFFCKILKMNLNLSFFFWKITMERVDYRLGLFFPKFVSFFSFYFSMLKWEYPLN